MTSQSSHCWRAMIPAMSLQLLFSITMTNTVWMAEAPVEPELPVVLELPVVPVDVPVDAPVVLVDAPPVVLLALDEAAVLVSLELTLDDPESEPALDEAAVLPAGVPVQAVNGSAQMDTKTGQRKLKVMVTP